MSAIDEYEANLERAAAESGYECRVIGLEHFSAIDPDEWQSLQQMAAHLDAKAGGDEQSVASTYLALMCTSPPVDEAERRYLLRCLSGIDSLRQAPRVKH
jgi:hypothetical protein